MNAYEYVKREVIKGVDEIPITSLNITMEELKSIVDRLMDDPWGFGIHACSSKSRDGVPIDLVIEYKYEKSKYVGMMARIRKKVDEITKELRLSDLDPISKIEAVHEYLVEKMTWDETLESQYDLSCILDGQGVCSGLANVAVCLLQAQGIEAKVVHGRIRDSPKDGPGHAWCLIKVSDRWYHFDPGFSTNYEKGIHVHSWCLVDDRTAGKNREWDTDSVPVADSMRDNYYYRRNLVATCDASLRKLLIRNERTEIEIKLEYNYDTQLVFEIVNDMMAEDYVVPDWKVFVFSDVLVIQEG